MHVVMGDDLVWAEVEFQDAPRDPTTSSRDWIDILAIRVGGVDRTDEFPDLGRVEQAVVDHLTALA